MIKTEQSDIIYLMKTMKLSEKEANNAARFINKHRACPRLNRSFNNVKYTISFSETSIGSFVKIECDKCHAEKDISDKVRSNW